MKTDAKIKDKNLQYGIKKKAAKYQYYHRVNLIKMNFLQARKYYYLIKVE